MFEVRLSATIIAWMNLNPGKSPADRAQISKPTQQYLNSSVVKTSILLQGSSALWMDISPQFFLAVLRCDPTGSVPCILISVAASPLERSSLQLADVAASYVIFQRVQTLEKSLRTLNKVYDLLTFARWRRLEIISSAALSNHLVEELCRLMRATRLLWCLFQTTVSFTAHPSHATATTCDVL